MSKSDIWTLVQSKFGRCDIAKQLSDSVLWRVILSERSRCGTAKQFSFFRRDIASQSADFDLGRFVQSELRSCDIANSLQMVTFGGRSFNESLESASILCSLRRLSWRGIFIEYLVSSHD